VQGGELDVSLFFTTVTKGVTFVCEVLAVHMGATALEQAGALARLLHARANLAAVGSGATNLAFAELDTVAAGLTACGPESVFSHLTVDRACLLVTRHSLLK